MQLTRSRVIAAAMALIEAEGVQAASMTRLATELGCSLVTLYSHVPSTQALLDGVAGAVIAGIQLTESPAGGWPSQLQAQARAARRAAMAHPRCAIAVAGRPPATAAALRPAERMLGTLRAAGLGGADARRLVQALAAYQVGSLVLEVGVAGGPAADAAGAASTRPVLRPDSFPNLTALVAEPGGADRAVCPVGDFEFGLELLLRGIAALLEAKLVVSAGGPL